MTPAADMNAMASPISVVVMTHNETQEFQWLMRALEPARGVIGEVVIVDDYSNADFLAVIRSYETNWPIRLFQRRLRQNFAAQRNFAKAQCRGRLILFPDADELPSTRLLLGLPELLAWMEAHNIDACTLPRFNIAFDGAVLPDPAGIDLADPALNATWEDQIRILRNLPDLRWTRRLHEYLIGARRIYKFPRSFDYVLIHAKTLRKVMKQRQFYRSLLTRHLSRHINSVVKRFGLRPAPLSVQLDPPI